MEKLSIKGVGKTFDEQMQSLIEIEPLLVMLGYDTPDESWNNRCSEGLISKNPHLSCFSDGTILYSNHNENGEHNNFKANEVEKIIQFINKVCGTQYSA